MDRYRTTAEIKFNVRDYLERTFVNNGLYFNVASGQLSVGGSRMDTLKKVDSKTYESSFDRWVCETDCSGIAPYGTTVCSGVIIDGVFHHKGSGTYKPVIDYANGRVLFTTAPTGTTITASPFSYKQVVVDYPESNRINLLFSSLRDNTDLTTYAYPSGNQRQVPVVVVDLQNTQERPFAMGGYKQLTQLIVFHILANNANDLDLIIDILAEQYRNVIKGVDYNKIPQQYTYQGDKATTYQSYTQLQNNVTYTWNRLYIDRVTVRERDVFYGMHRGRVDWDVNVIRAQ